MIVRGECETADLGRLGGHLDGRVHDGGETAAVSAVFRIVGRLALLVPVGAGGEVLLLLLLWCKKLSAHN